MAMTLSEYIADPARKAQLARDTNSSPDYLWQVATGWRGKRASTALAKLIEEHSGGAVTRASLRPDVWDKAA